MDRIKTLYSWAGTSIVCLTLSACNLTITPSDGGSVSRSPDSTQTCTAAVGECRTYANNVNVSLTPIAAPGYEFTGWTGACSGLGFCDLLMDEDREVQAEFTRIEDLTITDSDANLESVLEDGRIFGACDRYYANPEAASDYLTKMCGKYMFFYEGFGLLGVPTSIVEFMAAKLPQTVGKGFEKFGMIPDPYSTTGMPLGLPPGKPLAENVPSASFGCASCHFGKSKDGRYTVGQPNHDYEYGKQILAVSFFPFFGLAGGTPEGEFHPDTISLMEPLVAEFSTTNSFFDLLNAVLPLAGLAGDSENPITTLSVEQQGQYASWKTSNQDFLIDPVGMDDKVHTIHKIQSLWELPTPEEMESYGGPKSAMLASFGGTKSLEDFIQGFVALSLGDAGAYTPERTYPLLAYLLSLKAPKNPTPAPQAMIDRGEALFTSKDCASCHNGPRHSGTRLFTFEEIGTDPALKYWADGDLDGISDVPALVDNESLTHSVKAPRLTGLWSLKRFLHNGSVESLEDLFCVNSSRPTILELAYGDQGHMMTCEGLSLEEKQDLIAYLESL